MKRIIGEKYFKISIAAIFTVAASYLAIMLLGQAGPFLRGVFSAIGWIVDVIAPFLIGLIMAYLFLPIVEFFNRQLRKIRFFAQKPGMSRGISVFLMFLVIFLVIFGLLSLIISTFTSDIHFATPEEMEEMIRFVGMQAVNFYEEVRKALMNFEIIIPSFDSMVEEFKNQINSIDGTKGTSMAATLGTGVLGAFNILKNTLVSIFFAIIFSIYFLSGAESMSGYWKKAFRVLLGEKVYGICAEILSDLDKCLAGYIRGQFADALFMAVVVSISFGIAGIPYAAVIGIATGLGNLIPYVGPIIAYGMTIISCLIKGDLKLMLVGVIIVFVIQTIDGNIINPKLLSNSVNVHPALVVVALLFGGAIGGLLGMLLAVPLAAFIRIQFEKLIKYIEKKRAQKQVEKEEQVL
ncbi:MAG: AI-2E family transporter [Butyrivibrio sp.]|nr:AI-2E family transporter [Butyrivibrio sp.]